MKVKKLEVGDVKQGVYVVKHAASFANGSILNNPDVTADGKGIRINGARRTAFGFIYKMDEKLDVVVRKPKDVAEWPNWSPAMDKFDGHKLTITKGSIEDFEGKLYVMVDDNTGVSLNWLEPAAIPEFKEKTAAYMFHEVEIVLPKAPLVLSEVALLNNVSVIDAAERVKKNSYRSTANWAAVWDNGKILEKFSQACHADISRNHNGCSYIVTECRLTDEEQMWYGYWLANLSPVSDVFLVKDVHTIKEIGAYVLNADVPSDKLLLACIATRQVWEYQPTVKAFYHLCKAGIPADMAFLVAHMCDKCDENAMSFNRTNSGHAVMRVENMTVEHIRNWVEHKYVGGMESFKDKPCCPTTNGAFGSGGASSLHKAIREIGGELDRYGDRKAVPMKDAVKQAATVIAEWCKENL